jgi:hypothetical protein
MADVRRLAKCTLGLLQAAQLAQTHADVVREAGQEGLVAMVIAEGQRSRDLDRVPIGDERLLVPLAAKRRSPSAASDAAAGSTSTSSLAGGSERSAFSAFMRSTGSPYDRARP